MSDVEIHKVTLIFSTHTPDGDLIREAKFGGRLGVGSDPEAIAHFASQTVIREFTNYFPEGVK